MRDLWRGLIGLFVDDGWLALGTLACVGVAGALGRLAMWPRAASIALPAGLLTLLAASVLTAARRKRASALLSDTGGRAIRRGPRGP